MLPDVDAFADIVVLTVKTALAPVQERLAATETRLVQALAAEQALTVLRDRLVALETKAAMPPLPETALDALRDRVLALETKAVGPTAVETALTDLRDRVVTELRDRLMVVETKAAQPQAPDPVFEPLRERLLVLETKAAMPASVVATLDAREASPSVSVEAFTDVRDRLASVETRTPTRELWDAITASTQDLRARVASVEALAQDDSATKEIGALRERVAVVEVRAQVPGPTGKDGQDGKPGADGVGFEDLMAVQNDDRSFTIKAVRGDRVKDIGTARFPVQIQRGVYLEGKTYEAGDVVTWGGSQWACNEETTTKPGDGSKAWTLIVKRGRDGRDGQDAPGALPVVSVGRPR